MASQQGPFSTLPGPRRAWSFYTIWAEDGLVFLEDKEEGYVTILTCNEARGRLKGWIVDEVHTWDLRRTAAVNGQEKGHCNDMFFKMKNMLDVVEETLNEAVNQGDQNDPEVAKKKMLAFMRSKKAGQAHVGRGVSTDQYLARMLGARR